MFRGILVLLCASFMMMAMNHAQFLDEKFASSEIRLLDYSRSKAYGRDIGDTVAAFQALQSLGKTPRSVKKLCKNEALDSFTKLRLDCISKRDYEPERFEEISTSLGETV